MAIDYEDRFLGTVLGAAIGDALGAPFEGTPLVYFDMEPEIDLEKLSEICYTDDTHKGIGAMQSLIKNKGLNLEDLALTWADNVEEEPFRRYSKRTVNVLKLIKEGHSFVEANEIVGKESGIVHSKGNGAAMSVFPFALFFNDSPILEQIVYESSAITHSHEFAKEGAYLQAFAISRALNLVNYHKFDEEAFLSSLEQVAKSHEYKTRLKFARGFMRDLRYRKIESVEKIIVIDNLGTLSKASQSVITSIFSFMTHSDDFEEAIYYSISLGGDTDTIASMTSAISGAYLGYSRIPEKFLKKIENRGLLESLAIDLFKTKYKD